MIRTAGTAAGAGHTRGPGGVGPMREIISKGFAHVLSISPYHLPYPAALPCRPAGYSLGYASPYPLPPPYVCAHRDSAACLRSVEFWSQYGKLVGFCVFVGGGGYRYLAGDGAGIFFISDYVFGAVWWCFRGVFRCVFGADCRRFPRCVFRGVRMARVAVYVCNDISQWFFGVAVVVAAVVVVVVAVYGAVGVIVVVVVGGGVCGCCVEVGVCGVRVCVCVCAGLHVSFPKAYFNDNNER